MKQLEVDHINHYAQAVKGLRRAKRHVFQNYPDDVFRVHIQGPEQTPSLQDTIGRPVTIFSLHRF